VAVQVDARAKAGFLSGRSILLLEISNKGRSIMRLKKYTTLSGGVNVSGYFLKQRRNLNKGGRAVFDTTLGPLWPTGIPFQQLTNVGFAHLLYPDFSNPKYFFYIVYSLDGFLSSPEVRIPAPRHSNTLNRLNFRAIGSIASSTVTLMQKLDWPGMLSTALALPVMNGNEFDLLLKGSRDNEEGDLWRPKLIELVPRVADTSKVAGILGNLKMSEGK
jgi:hypothetical protein